jgi:SAM-dependent methyltransferase
VAHSNRRRLRKRARLESAEIGCGLGTDGAQFAEAGADYTGVDLTEAAVDLARKRFELFALPGKFQTADAENLDFANESFDLVYSHGVLHHTPRLAKPFRKFIGCCAPAAAP